MPVVAEAGQRIGQCQPHRRERAVHGALVEHDREQRPDERRGEKRRALPQHDEHQRRRRHERKRHDGCAHVRAHQVQIGLAAAKRDRGRDQNDVDEVVRSRGEHDARDYCADGLAMDRSDQGTCRECDKRENCDVEGDALQRPVLGELDDGCRREQ